MLDSLTATDTFLFPTLIVLSLPDDGLNLCLKSGVRYNPPWDSKCGK